MGFITLLKDTKSIVVVTLIMYRIYLFEIANNTLILRLSSSPISTGLCKIK